MNGNYTHLFIAVGVLLVAVLVLNIVRAKLRKRKYLQSVGEAVVETHSEGEFNSDSITPDSEQRAPQQLNLNIESVDQYAPGASTKHPESKQTQAQVENKTENETKANAQDKTQHQAPTQQTASKTTKQSAPAQNDLVMVSVHAPRGKNFSDYNFLQTLGSAGLTFGEHQIFHYDIKTEYGDKRLFSVAKLNKPGTFDIDNIESMDCQGLLLFVNLKQCDRIQLAIDCLLDTAQQLADDLEGNLFEGYNTPWTEATAANILKKIEEYPRAKSQANLFNRTEVEVDSVY